MAQPEFSTQLPGKRRQLPESPSLPHSWASVLELPAPRSLNPHQPPSNSREVEGPLPGSERPLPAPCTAAAVPAQELDRSWLHAAPAGSRGPGRALFVIQPRGRAWARSQAQGSFFQSSPQRSLPNPPQGQREPCGPRASQNRSSRLPAQRLPCFAPRRWGRGHRCPRETLRGLWLRRS